MDKAPVFARKTVVQVHDDPPQRAFRAGTRCGLGISNPRASRGGRISAYSAEFSQETGQYYPNPGGRFPNSVTDECHTGLAERQVGRSGFVEALIGFGPQMVLLCSDPNPPSDRLNQWLTRTA